MIVLIPIAVLIILMLTIGEPNLATTIKQIIARRIDLGSKVVTVVRRIILIVLGLLLLYLLGYGVWFYMQWCKGANW